MARRIIKSTVPWPEETRENYRLIQYKIERVTVNLLSLLNEAAEHNYSLYEDEEFIGKVWRRLEEAHNAALDIVKYAPTDPGRPPMWVTITGKVIKTTQKMLTALVEIKRLASVHLFDTAIKSTEVMLDDCLDLLEGFKRVPLDNGNDEDEDNNGDVLYFLDLSSFINKK